MENLIKTAISEILKQRTDLVPLFVRQKSKFEGWLKFDLVNYLEVHGMKDVEVESKNKTSFCRCDISFSHDYFDCRIELKTPNTNWKIKGVKSSTRPITKNIQSIIDDTIKLNSAYGIVAFVLFPIPLNHDSWKIYIQRISEETGIYIDDSHCNLIEVDIDKENKCNMLVCSYKSKVFNKYFG